MHHVRFAALALLLFPALAWAGAEVGVERWQHDHPEAARDLGTWVQGNTDAARKFFEWDSKHPEKCKEFVHWSVDNPTLGIDAFASTHPKWPVFDVIMERHKPAAELFIAWTRKHHDAAKSLMQHARGLAWLGKNAYAID